MTNILLRCGVNPGALDNIELVQVFELLQIAADALAHTERRAEDETMAALRPRPQVMWLTEAAAERIKAVMAKADRPIEGTASVDLTVTKLARALPHPIARLSDCEQERLTSAGFNRMARLATRLGSNSSTRPMSTVGLVAGLAPIA